MTVSPCSFAMIGRNMPKTIIRPCILIYKRTEFQKSCLNIKMTPVSNFTDLSGHVFAVRYYSVRI